MHQFCIASTQTKCLGFKQIYNCISWFLYIPFVSNFSMKTGFYLWNISWSSFIIILVRWFYAFSSVYLIFSFSSDISLCIWNLHISMILCMAKRSEFLMNVNFYKKKLITFYPGPEKKSLCAFLWFLLRSSVTQT